MLRPSYGVPGRRLASSRGREHRAGRRASLWPGDLRNDGGGVAGGGAVRDGGWLDGTLDGTLCPHDRRSEEVRRVEHAEPGRLERGARARGPREGRSATQGGAG